MISFANFVDRTSTASVLLAAVVLLAARPANAQLRSGRASLELQDLVDVTGDSYVKVREFAVPGDHISFSDLGVRRANVPGLVYRYRFDERNSVVLRLRYFVMRGRRELSAPLVFNGATMAPGQTLRTTPGWWSAAAFYGRTWTPADWRLTGLIGVEYTAIDFRINGGHAAVAPGSVTTETKEGFLVQELPVPTLGIEAGRRVSPSLVAEGALEGNWINHWNSLRREGGTMYLSQSKIEAHLRLRWSGEARWRRVHPMVGAFVHAYRQHEVSGEDDNLIVFTAWGPELGVAFDF